MPLPSDVIAALWGAGAGAVAGTVSTIGIAWGTSVVQRRRRAKAIKVALYYEIFGHNIIEIGRTKGSPDFLLLGFARASYDAYLDEIPDLLHETLVGELSTYYAKVTTAASQQQRIEDDTTKGREVTGELIRLQTRQTITDPVHPDEVELVKQESQQIADRLVSMMDANRILLMIAMAQQERLLATLRKEFKNDPAEEPREVLPEHQKWFDKHVLNQKG
jgi:hypothetical protein